MKPVSIKKKEKAEREQQVLLGLIELYLETGKPIGSTTLQETLFSDLSSATIRNYLAKLESEGFLNQQHSSGGREPTELGYQEYVKEYSHKGFVQEGDAERLASLKGSEVREISKYLVTATELLSDILGLPVFLSAPRFDNDVILDVKVISIDQTRCLCVLVTDFGLIHTETLYIDTKLTAFSTKRIEEYFRWRLTGQEPPQGMSNEEGELAHRFYNELMVRYIVNYSHFTHDDIHRTGFSRLLAYPEFSDAVALTSGLSLFEDAERMRHLLRFCTKDNKMKYWIGTALQSGAAATCSVIATPYHTSLHAVGAVGVLGPMRMPYRRLFGTLQMFSAIVSEMLTRSLYKYKLSYRRPKAFGAPILEDGASTGLITPILLENKMPPNHGE